MQLLLSLQERRLSHIKLLLWSSGKNIGSELEKSLWSSGIDNGSELQVDSSSNQESHCGPVVKTMGQNFRWTQVQIRKVTVVQW
ncbi:uncharacterized protein LOC144089861 isoform X5 [Stigmatopora argus]